jgi:hypothetical protein
MHFAKMADMVEPYVTTMLINTTLINRKWKYLFDILNSFRRRFKCFVDRVSSWRNFVISNINLIHTSLFTLLRFTVSRNMSRLWNSIKWKVKCVSSWYCLLRNYIRRRFKSEAFPSLAQPQF